MQPPNPTTPTSPPELVLCLSNFPDQASAAAAARALVAEGLAACVNILPGVQSIYGWQGKIEESAEVTCLIKSTRARQPALFARLAALHPYEVPELVAIPTLAVNPAYLAWAAALCRAAPAEAAETSCPTAPDEEASAD